MEIARRILVFTVAFGAVFLLLTYLARVIPTDQGGIVAPEPEPTTWHLTELVMHTQEGCEPCRVWKLHELPQAKADGIKVTFAGPDSRGTPAFDAHYCKGDQCKVRRFSNVPYAEMKNANPDG